MLKARRPEDPRNYTLMEEVTALLYTDSPGGTSKRRNSTENIEKRQLGDDENVYQAQCEWKSTGKFVLMEKGSVFEVRRMQLLCFGTLSTMEIS
jgi:hypothetical protein